MADLISILTACGTEGLPSDPDFQNVTLLLHGDGTNGAQNNTFLDSSTNNFTITRNGNTTQGTFSPFSKVDGRWGNYFDGTDDYLSVADNAVLRPGAGAFTLEAWIYRNADGAAHTIYAKGGASTGISFLVTSGNVLRFTHTTTNIDSSGTVAANAWVHVAVVREGTGTNQTKLYINGTQDGQGTVSTDFTQTEEVRIGTNRGATDDFAGYISNVRFVKGSALYTGNFTPSTSPFTTTSQGASSSEVELLTCQSNRFIDNSTNNFTITRNGNVRVTPFSPFPTLTAYDAATNGGSGYFDGTGDYLTLSNNAALDLGNSAFCIEAWVYPTTTGVARPIFNSWDTATAGSREYTFGITSTNTLAFSFYNSGGTLNSDLNAGTIVPSAWNHCVACRDASNNWALFINGSRVDTLSSSDTIRSLTNNYVIGEYLNTGSFIFTGNMSGLRVIKGSTPYDPTSTTLTVPTAPPTAVSDTQLLLNYTNAGIIDNSMSNNLETVGNAQIDTTTKKYGTGSMEFDGTGDALHIVSNPALYLSTGNFTIEGWVYTTTATTSQTIMVRRASQTARGFVIGISNLVSGKLSFACGDTDTTAWEVQLDSTTSLANNTWYHFAVVRDGNDFELFINGISEDTATSSVVIADDTSLLRIGLNDVGTNGLNGFIDDLRITKGKARYTSAFTPPTAAFPDIGE